MRPIKLIIEGINSFVSAQTVDFEKAGANNLFCISGSTGSGKTTILDCIILALYNNHSERGNLTDYINLRCESGKIQFTFELLGDIYQTERVLSRKENKNSMLLKKMGEEIPLFEGRKAYEFLAEKIGLTVAEFTNVVVLQQGRFAKFLKAEKRERIELINKLFDLRRFENLYSKFNSRAQEKLTEVKGFENSLALYDGYTDEGVETALKEYEKIKTEGDVSLDLLKKAKENAEKLRLAYQKYAEFLKAKGEVERAEGKLSVLKNREEKKREYEEELQKRESALKEKEKTRDKMVERVGALKTALEKRAEASEKIKRADEELFKIEEEKKNLSYLSEHIEKLKIEEAEWAKKIATLKEKIDYDFSGNDELDGRELSSALASDKTSREHAKKNLDSAKEKSERAREEVKRHQEQWTVMQSAHAKLEESEKKAKEEQERVILELEDALNKNSAYRVQASLKVGDLCPVCGNHIVEKPTLTLGDIDALKEKSERAKADYLLVLSAMQKSQSALSAFAERLNGAFNKEKESELALLEAQKESEKWDKANLDFRDEQVKAFVSAVSSKASLSKDIETLVGDIKLMQESVKVRYSSALSVKTEGEEAKKRADEIINGDGEEEIKRIRTALSSLTLEREELDRDKAKAVEASMQIEGEKKSALALLESAKERLIPCDEVTAETLKGAEEEANAREKAHQGLLVEIEGKRKDYEHQKERLSEKKELLKGKAEAEKGYNRYHDMASLFYHNAFNEFVVAEFVKEFTALASVQLGELTGGKYSLDYDEDKGDFFVRDFLSNNERRSIKTLSGGETFLASLSLAIAISRELSRNKNYEFFFIDEGFGTLSPDSIDMVVEALCSLSKETLVGVITHRGELIERIDEVVTVTGADEGEGSKISQ